MRRVPALCIAPLLFAGLGMTASSQAVDGVLAKMEWLRSSHEYGGACIRIRSNPVIVVDPAGLAPEACEPRADLIIVTHDHDDHFSPATIARLRSAATTLVGPATVIGKAGSDRALAGIGRVTAAAGRTLSVKGVTIEPFPAYSLASPAHPRDNGWLGYVVTVEGVRILLTGDTSLTPELRGRRDIDIVVANIRGPYQLDRDEVTALAGALGPRVLIPVHWVDGERADAEFIVRHAPAPTRVVLLGAR